MKYYLIAGEASGDLHASRLMDALRRQDREAQFRFFGGSLMGQQGGTLVQHYRDGAYMGFLPVLLHLPAIFRRLARCKADIASWQPDVVVLVDYPGFNLRIAKYIKKHLRCPVCYYISPKIWGWKEWRIKTIRQTVDAMLCILPFEVDFYEKRHGYPVHYVGNPTAEEVRRFRRERAAGQAAAGSGEAAGKGLAVEDDGTGRPVIALLAGSRKQEIEFNLPAMIEATRPLAGRYRVVLAGAPGIEPSLYAPLVADSHVEVVFDQTYPLLFQAHAALVTSGTATLETALFGVPQVVCYKTRLPRFIGLMRRLVVKVEWISLVNLIASREVVPELVADTFSVGSMKSCLQQILDGPGREAQLAGYAEVERRLGSDEAPARAAEVVIGQARRGRTHNS